MKRVLVLCNANATRGHIVGTIKVIGYNVIRVEDNIKALENLQNSGVADLVIIGQHANAGILKEWLENNCPGVPIIVIVGCECEERKIAHTDYEVGVSELDQLPSLIKRLIGHPSPLS